MGLIRECDIYPGRTKGVKKYAVTITPVGNGLPSDGDPAVQRELFMCPAALKRAGSFLARATKAPNENAALPR